MIGDAEVRRRTRVSAVSDRPPLTPFVRAKAVTQTSIYWLPVSQFTIPARQREWILAFLERLTAQFASRGLFPETLLQLKYTRKELNKRFTQTLLEYQPVTGLLLTPGQGVPSPPSSLEIKKVVDNANSEAEVDIEHLVPDYCAWFLEKQEQAQRRDFFGVGGMLTMWIKLDEENAPARLPISRALTSHPGFAAYDFEAQFRKLHSMRAPWLKQSKKVFGGRISDEAIYEGVPFVLPRLNATAFTEATPEQLAEWFGVFHAYCIESEIDKGILLAVGQPDFDQDLQNILDGMYAENLEYVL